MNILYVFLFGLVLAVMILTYMLGRYYQQERQEKKAAEDEKKRQAETYKEEMKENEKIISNLDPVNIVERLHELTTKGNKRKN